ncbi:hypothetical protein ATCC90586_012235 [Pythium insidiosum]|nr:hypothetical protein ATCC90586_012235 [Pythium insidiosum]
MGICLSKIHQDGGSGCFTRNNVQDAPALPGSALASGAVADASSMTMPKNLVAPLPSHSIREDDEEKDDHEAEDTPPQPQPNTRPGTGSSFGGSRPRLERAQTQTSRSGKRNTFAFSNSNEAASFLSTLPGVNGGVAARPATSAGTDQNGKAKNDGEAPKEGGRTRHMSVKPELFRSGSEKKRRQRKPVNVGLDVLLKDERARIGFFRYLEATAVEDKDGEMKSVADDPISDLLKIPSGGSFQLGLMKDLFDVYIDKEVEQFQLLPHGQKHYIQIKARKIFDKFVRRGGKLEIELPMDVRRDILFKLSSPSEFTFVDALKYVFTLWEHNFCTESIYFWLDCNEYKDIPHRSYLKLRAQKIYRKYISGRAKLQVPTWGFRLGWVAILVLHGLCAFYFSLNAHVYGKTPGSSLGVGLVAYNIGMPMDNYGTLKAVHAFFAALHVLLGAVMVVWSIYQRRFSFGPLQELALDGSSKTGSKVIADKDARSSISRRFSSITTSVSRRVTESGRLGSFVSKSSRGVQLIASLFSRQGFFGVESPHFEEILAVREIVESVLQAYQAYRMSQLLARPWLNRFYVAMLVVNCWMVPIVHFVFRRNVMLRRALSLLCDAVLDFTSAMVVPTVLLFSYYADFDTSVWGFPYVMWYDDGWCVRVMTEFQIMLVTSWGDLASRCVFSFGLISCIESTKELLREAPSSGDGHRHKTTPSEPNEQPGKPRIAPRRSSARVRIVSSFRELQSTPLRRILQTFQAVCAVLGAVIVVLHLYAESVAPLDECVIQVHPWLERKPACIFLQWDCEAPKHKEDLIAIETQWTKASAGYVRRMLVVHCPNFEMPALISRFQELVGIKMYNTTIASWNEEAALTATHHPAMILTYFVRVNMSDTGELPPGLLAPSFPPMLWDIEIAISNLKRLPDDVDTKWPQYMYFTCEVCEFTAVPSALHRMVPYWVEFGRNPFGAFPFEPRR